MKYMLICVAERDIEEPEFFDTLEEAHTAMCEQLADVYGVPVEDIKESYVNESSAWGERHGNNFDWKIFEVR